MEKIGKVSFYRHHRVLDDFGNAENNYAASFRFDLDFDTRNITASFAVCNGDQFRKSFARGLTDERIADSKYVFPMPNQMDGWEDSVTSQFVNTFYHTDSKVRALVKRHTKMLKQSGW